MTTVVCASVSAQEPQPTRPYRGLFGGDAPNPNAPNRLGLTISLFGGYDDNVLAGGAGGEGTGGGGTGQGVVSDPRFMKSSGYEGGQASLDYMRRLGPTSIDASAGTSYRYYPSVGEMTGFNHWATIGLSVPLGRRASIRLTEAANYSPFFGYSPMSGLIEPSIGEIPTLNGGQALVERAAVTYTSAAAFDYRLSKRGTLTADYSLRYTDFRHESRNYSYASGGGAYSYRLTSHAGLHLGYHYRNGRLPSYYGTDVELPNLRSHDIDAGVDYSRSLSITRRTTFGFGSGSSIVRGQDQGYYSSSNRTLKTRYTLNLNANLNRQIGQSWTARLDYRRGFHTVEGFSQPFFDDSVTFSLGGYAGRRMNLSFTGAYTTGQVGMNKTSGNDHETWTGSAHWQFGITSMLAIYADYFYYHYRFGSAVLLPTGMGRELDRQGVVGGLKVRLPLI